MTAAPESPESALAAVLAEKWVREALWDHTQHRSTCSCPEDGETAEDLRCVQHRRYQVDKMTVAVLAALDPILAATPTAARIEADGGWEFCSWCVERPEDGPCEIHSPEAARIAQLEADLAASDRAFDVERSTNIRVSRELMKAQADLAAARSALDAVEALADELCAADETRVPAKWASDDIRAALATPPQPAPGQDA